MSVCYLCVDIERAAKIAGELPYQEEAGKMVEIVLLKKTNGIDIRSEERLAYLLEKIVEERNILDFYVKVQYINRTHDSDYPDPFGKKYHYEHINKYRGHAAWQIARGKASLSSS